MAESKEDTAFKTVTPQSGSVNDPTAAPNGRIGRARVPHCVHKLIIFREGPRCLSQIPLVGRGEVPRCLSQIPLVGRGEASALAVEEAAEHGTRDYARIGLFHAARQVVRMESCLRRMASLRRDPLGLPRDLQERREPGRAVLCQ